MLSCVVRHQTAISEAGLIGWYRAVVQPTSGLGAIKAVMPSEVATLSAAKQQHCIWCPSEGRLCNTLCSSHRHQHCLQYCHRT
jgi:hypothetical protein